MSTAVAIVLTGQKSKLHNLRFYLQALQQHTEKEYFATISSYRSKIYELRTSHSLFTHFLTANAHNSLGALTTVVRREDGVTVTQRRVGGGLAGGGQQGEVPGLDEVVIVVPLSVGSRVGVVGRLSLHSGLSQLGVQLLLQTHRKHIRSPQNTRQIKQSYLDRLVRRVVVQVGLLIRIVDEIEQELRVGSRERCGLRAGGHLVNGVIVIHLVIGSVPLALRVADVGMHQLVLSVADSKRSIAGDVKVLIRHIQIDVVEHVGASSQCIITVIVIPTGAHQLLGVIHRVQLVSTGGSVADASPGGDSREPVANVHQTSVSGTGGVRKDGRVDESIHLGTTY